MKGSTGGTHLLEKRKPIHWLLIQWQIMRRQLRNDGAYAKQMARGKVQTLTLELN